jgi:hypothetical protein
VKTTPHAARGNKTQARGILQIADVAKQWANEQENKLSGISHSFKQLDDAPYEVE